MKRGIVSIVAVLAMTGCAMVAPDAGQEAVLIRKPYIFGSGGVVPDPVHTGRRFVAVSTSWIYVSKQPQQFTLHFEDLMSLDGVPMDFDSVIRVRVTDSVKLVTMFGDKWYEANVASEVSNRVRQAVRKHGLNETAIDTKAIDDIDREVSESLLAYIKTADLPLELIDFTVGKANPPDAIKNQRIATAEQQQRSHTEKERKLAEDQREAAEVSRARADNAYREAMRLSPEQFLTLENIHMQKEVCARGGCTFILGDAVPVVGGKK